MLGRRSRLTGKPAATAAAGWRRRSGGQAAAGTRRARWGGWQEPLLPRDGRRKTRLPAVAARCSSAGGWWRACAGFPSGTGGSSGLRVWVLPHPSFPLCPVKLGLVRSHPRAHPFGCCSADDAWRQRPSSSESVLLLLTFVLHAAQTAVRTWSHTPTGAAPLVGGWYAPTATQPSQPSPRRCPSR